MSEGRVDVAEAAAALSEFTVRLRALGSISVGRRTWRIRFLRWLRAV